MLAPQNITLVIPAHAVPTVPEAAGAQVFAKNWQAGSPATVMAEHAPMLADPAAHAVTSAPVPGWAELFGSHCVGEVFVQKFALLPVAQVDAVKVHTWVEPTTLAWQSPMVALAAPQAAVSNPICELEDVQTLVP